MTQRGYGQPKPDEHDPPLLFNLNTDPGETFNVAGAHPEVGRRVVAGRSNGIERAWCKRHRNWSSSSSCSETMTPVPSAELTGIRTAERGVRRGDDPLRRELRPDELRPAKPAGRQVGTCGKPECLARN